MSGTTKLNAVSFGAGLDVTETVAVTPPTATEAPSKFVPVSTTVAPR